MHRLYIAMAMVAMLAIGLVAGALFTRSAQAQNTPTHSGAYVVLKVDRVDANDPIAVVLNTNMGSGYIVYKNGSKTSY